MAHRFKPCINRTACTEDGERCRSCGRSHEEINAIRNITNQVADFILQREYSNSEEFLDYLVKKVSHKLIARRRR